jgi:hypothetical protein
MSIPGSVNPLFLGAAGQATGGGGYQISRSVRFNSSDSAYLSKNLSTGSTTAWSFSVWVKKSLVTTSTDYRGIFTARSAANNYAYLDFSDNGIRFANRPPSGTIAVLQTTPVFRDPSAWFHVLFHFIDGQALDPSSFGEFDTNGVWQPIDASGLTFGTNGFHLPFSNNSTAAALGTDTSSNGNTWTVNNISVTAGAGNDSLVDSPTNGSQVDTGVGGEVVGNYATLNPLWGGTSLTNGNLESTLNATRPASLATIAPSSGKWYFETYITGTNPHIGLFDTAQFDTGSNTSSYVRGSDGALIGLTGGSFTFGQNDLVQCAVDFDGGTIKCAKNGGAYTTFTINNTNAPNCFMGFLNTGIANFGQRQWAYAAPAGFKALCTTNLPEPTIADGSTAMDVALYTGNGSTQTISGLNFSPDFAWFKRRGPAAASHFLFDQVRGAGKFLVSNTTAVEGDDSVNTLQSFNSDGYTMGSTGAMNESGSTYVVWSWDAGSSTVTNTAGSITSQVRANASAGFSVVTFTSSSSVSTVGHGLGVTPYLIITKNRSVSNTWWTYHNAIGNTKAMRLDTTDAQTTISSTWNNTSPTSTVFTVGGEWGNDNNIVAYCFAPVAGYSSMGSWTAAAPPVFVYTGFRPAFLLAKSTTTANPWYIRDNKRSAVGNGNPTQYTLFPNTSAAEGDDFFDYIDFVSNGFVIRAGSGGFTNAGTVIYYAVAESPFAYSRAR